MLSNSEIPILSGQKTKLNHIALLLVFLFSANFVFSQHKFTDKRDGQTYKTVKIGNQYKKLFQYEIRISLLSLQ